MTKIRKITIGFITMCLIIGAKCFATTGSVNAPNGLVLRETASKGANPIITISDKETVEIEETLDEWYKVKYNGYEGYLYKEYVDANEEEKTTEEKVEEKADVETETEKEEAINNQETAATIENSVYPQQATTNSTVKIYVIPSITATVLNTIDANSTVTVTKTVNSWAYIKNDENISGWIRKSFLSISETNVDEVEEKDETETEAKEEVKKEETQQNQTTYESKKGYINASTSANVRSEASTSSSVLTTLTTNTEVTIIGEDGDWYKVTYGSYTGYISKSLISDKQVTTTSRGNISRNSEEESSTSETEDTTETTTTTNSALEGGAQVADLAQQCIGCSYVYGGTSTSGFDCSGFTQYVYSSCGYSINRTASAQSNNGYEVSKDELIPGDLLLFNNTSDGSIGHVGIYIGGGTFVHAANSRRGVTTDTINSGYYNTYYYSARRIAD